MFEYFPTNYTWNMATVRAVNSPNRELKVFTFAEGGEDHCQIDNTCMAVDYMADWVAELFGGNPQGV
jgi:hypothetical protein